MFLVGHAAVGVLLASASGTENPGVAFGIGWLSHYLADFFPHGDEEIGDWTKKGNEVRRLAFVVAIDFSILLAATIFFVARNGWSWPLAAAAFGSAVPDILWGLEKLFKKTLFGPHEKFHFKNHNFFDIRIPAKAGLPLQSLVTTMLWGYLILGA